MTDTLFAVVCTVEHHNAIQEVCMDETLHTPGSVCSSARLNNIIMDVKLTLTNSFLFNLPVRER